MDVTHPSRRMDRGSQNPWLAAALPYSSRPPPRQLLPTPLARCHRHCHLRRHRQRRRLARRRKKMLSVHFSMVLRGRPRRRGTSSSPNRDAVCSTQAANLRLSESEGKRKKELTPFFRRGCEPGARSDCGSESGRVTSFGVQSVEATPEQKEHGPKTPLGRLQQWGGPEVKGRKTSPEGTQPETVGEARPVEPSSKQWSFSLRLSVAELRSSWGVFGSKLR